MQNDTVTAPRDSIVVVEPRPAGPAAPPDNAQYMIAAYILTALIVGGYALALLRRATREARAKSG